jgi:heme/copper-type cytochrome/quinol oxidase subunit 3
VGIAVAVLVATGGVGAGLAFLAYQADRQLRVSRAHAADIAAAGGPVVRAPLVALAPEPATELLVSQGQVEVPPALGLSNTKFGMWIFLASEIMFFTALIATFATFKFRGVITDNGLLRNSLWLVAVNTNLLLTSSLAVVLALDAVRDGRRQRFFTWMIVTAILGAIFVGLQAVEWTTLMGEGITATSSLFGTTFYLTTGFHGAHVIIGVIWLFSIIARARLRGEYTPDNNLGYELFGLYWHFVDIVWIILFTVIYLL